MEQDGKITPADLLKVSFSRMRLDPDNERTDLGDIDWLVKNIREEGVKSVMDGYKGKEDGEGVIFIRDGSRRFKAMEIIYEGGNGLNLIAFVKTYDKRTLNKEQSVVDRFIKNEGKPFTPLEKATAVSKLLAYNWDEKKIADKLGMSVMWVNNMAILNALPQKVKELVANGTISATLAIREARKGESNVETLVEKVNEAPAQAPQQASLLDDAPKPVKEKKPRVTAKDLAPEINSWKEYKTWVKTANETNMSATAVAFHKFMLKILNNEVSEKDFNQFFFRSND